MSARDSRNEVMDRAIRRLGILEHLFIGMAAVAALVAGAMVAWLLGLVADMLDRIRVNQERILYYHKKHAFDDERRGLEHADE